MQRFSNEKFLALLQEFETSYKLIIIGFKEIQNFELGNSFYFLSFQLLSQGFERFMKAYICIAYFNVKCEFPTDKYLKYELGHNLNTILNVLMKDFFYSYDRSQYLIDRDFLMYDDKFRNLLGIISDFGQNARYHNFNIISDSKVKTDDVINRWQEFENSFLFSSEELMNKIMSPNVEEGNEVKRIISREIIILFEKFIAAISRQMSFKLIGDEALKLSSGDYMSFAMMYGKDFGNKDYRILIDKNSSSHRKPHKRNIGDFIKRKFSKKYKSKLVVKHEYGDNWPFYVDKVTIECRDKHWCVVTIDGYDYALNGSAKGRYNLPLPHEAGMGILGKDVSQFIRIARELYIIMIEYLLENEL